MTAYFRDLENHLVSHIRQADVVIGCVAWLTSKRILGALAKVKGTALVVQKEDFLRPDIDSHGQNWPMQLRQLYSQLKCPDERHQFPGLMGELSICSDPIVQPVRCVGNYNRDKSPAFPRMHHKFIVLCRYEKRIIECSLEDGPQHTDEITIEEIVPYGVWTGSFNFTKNAARSLENGLMITDLKIVRAYYDEWARVEAISEELDWTSDWAVPEWRVGT